MPLSIPECEPSPSPGRTIQLTFHLQSRQERLTHSVLLHLAMKTVGPSPAATLSLVRSILARASQRAHARHSLLQGTLGVKCEDGIILHGQVSHSNTPGRPAHAISLQRTVGRTGGFVSPPQSPRAPWLTWRHSVAFPGVYTSCERSELATKIADSDLITPRRLRRIHHRVARAHGQVRRAEAAVALPALRPRLHQHRTHRKRDHQLD